jgi:5-methylcytosine-specific restriction endonuclease McrA
MGSKLTYEYVYNYFKNHDCELLSKEYNGSQSKLQYKCSCGNISEITFASFQQGSRCRFCRSNQYTFEYVKQYFIKNNCQLLENSYINNQTKMKYKCVCGNISYISFSSFLKGSRCKECGIKKYSSKNKLSYQEVYDYFKTQNCELLELEYVNNSTPMKYRCECGNIAYIKLGNFKNGQRCMKCSGTNKLNFEHAYNCFKERGYELLDIEYKNDATKMKYKCSLGHISYITLNNLKHGYGCGKCADINNSGPNNARWNPNLTDEQRKENESRQSDPRIKQWRKEVFKRDSYICQICGQKHGDINAHHLNSYADFPEQRYEIDNGVTLCEKDHMEFHRLYTYYHNTEQQFIEFKNNQIQLQQNTG